jgi:outer membrane protein TolC
MRFKFLVLGWLFTTVVHAQTDSTQIFSYRAFYELILRNHPVMKQSVLLPEDARAELLMAKGNFDPKFTTGYDRKFYEGKEYFNFWDSQLKVPVYWGGVDVKAGFERNVGLVLGTDIQTPLDGLSYLGVNVPLGQGLLIDSRRATLQNAQIFQNIAEAERVKMLNKLILTAAKDYWDWYFAYRQAVLAQEFYDFANQRFQLTKQRNQGGDVAAIDTVDAKVTLLDRLVALEQAQVELLNARLVLSNHLWDENQVPRELPVTAIPQPIVSQRIDTATLQDLLERARQNHPDIQKLVFKNQQLRVDERLSREQLKPRLDVGLTSLNYLHRIVVGNPDQRPTFAGDYKLNVDLAFPIFFRKERGKLQQIRIKQSQNNLELQQNRREISNQISASYNDVLNIEKQIRDQENAIQNQTLVLRAEERRFSIGESQLFLVNQREAKLNELRVKLESMRSKYEKAKATLLFAAGLSEW